jgi:hypothetical protein
MDRMSDLSLQALCELGQAQLMETDYLAAITTLKRAESLAWDTHDFDTLSRLYFPLQEAHRQRRQRCGEGIVRLDLIATDAANRTVDPDQIIAQYPHGQLLVAGWGGLEASLRLRELADSRAHYVETFLAAAYPIVGGAVAVVIVPLADVRLPDPIPRSIDALLALIPPHSIVLPTAGLPNGPTVGNAKTFAQTMALWEQLHAPYLAAADTEGDLLRKMAAYRKVISIDYACELAHQKLAATAREASRTLGQRH